jgi:hypothetical protein
LTYAKNNVFRVGAHAYRMVGRAHRKDDGDRTGQVSLAGPVILVGLAAIAPAGWGITITRAS